MKWTLWTIKDKTSWSIENFIKVYDITSPQTFWELYNNLDKIGGVSDKTLFLMVEDIFPRWESSENIKGGCWSFKVPNNYAEEIWLDLSIHLVTNTISTKTKINGIALSLKKNGISIAKIWNDNAEFNSLTNLNPEILSKWGTDVIYIAHVTENDKHG